MLILLLSKWCNWCEYMTGFIPSVLLQCLAGKKQLSFKHLAWIFLWGLIIQHMKVGGPLWPLQRNSSLFGNTDILHLPATWDSIKVDTFLLCFRSCIGCQDSQGVTGEEWEKPLGMCRQDAVRKPTGASSTWEDTHGFWWELFSLSCLQSWTWREAVGWMGECKLFPPSIKDKLCNTWC